MPETKAPRLDQTSGLQLRGHSRIHSSESLSATRSFTELPGGPTEGPGLGIRGVYMLDLTDNIERIG